MTGACCKTNCAMPARWMALCLLVAVFTSCAPGRHYDARDFPAASSAEGGVSVTWRGRLLDIRHSPPRRAKDAVRAGSSPRWFFKFRTIESKPCIPPFVPGRKVAIAVENPLVFLGTNNFHVGDSLAKTLLVWRSPAGELCAVDR